MRPGTRWRLAGGGLLGLGLLFLFFRGIDWAALLSAFRSADPAPLAAVAVVTVAVYLARAWRWGYLLSGLTDVPFPRLFSATLVGFMTGLLVPRAGEVVRPYLVARGRDLRTSAAFASIILERLVDVVTVVFLFGIYLYVLPAPSAQTRGDLLGALKLGGGLAGLAAVALTLLLLAFHAHAERTVAVLDRALSRVPRKIARPVSEALRSFGEGLGVLHAPPSHLLAILGQSLVVWLLIAMGIFCTNRAFGLELPFHSAFLIIIFLTVGVAIPTPGMVGGFHEFYLLALTHAYGVDRATAAAAGIACHALTNLPVLVLGLFFLAREGLTVAGVTEIGEQTGRAAPAPGVAATLTSGRTS